MPSHVSVAEVQSWLQDTRLTIAEVDSELEDTAATTVLAALAAVYDTSGWTDDTDTPALVRKIIAMYVAAWEYQRAYSDNDDVSNYCAWLEGKADKLLMALTTGTIILPEEPPIIDVGMGIGDFYPTDTDPPEGPKFLIEQVF